METSTLNSSLMSEAKIRGEPHRNYSEETFCTDSSEDVQSKCKSATSLLRKRQHLGGIGGYANPYRNATRTTIASSARHNVSSVGRTVMSAKVLRIKQLQSEIMNVQYQLNELATENRLLKTLQRRQDMALKKYEGTHADLPQLIDSHNEEVRALKAKLKQAKAQNRDLEKRLKTRESELQTLQEQHKHLLQLAKDRHLGEREQLQMQLDEMQNLLKEQDKRLQMLTRKTMLEGKNYKHQLTTVMTRYKEIAKERDSAREKVSELEALLESKEKFISAQTPRNYPHHSVSLVSFRSSTRFRRYQSDSKSSSRLQNGKLPSTRSSNEESLIEEQREEEEDYDDDDDEEEEDDAEEEENGEESANEDDREMLAVKQKMQNQIIHQSKKTHVSIREVKERSDDNDDSSGQEESTKTVRSIEKLNRSSEGIQGEDNDHYKEGIRKLQITKKVSANHMADGPGSMEKPLGMRRWSLGAEERVAPAESEFLSEEKERNLVSGATKGIPALESGKTSLKEIKTSANNDTSLPSVVKEPPHWEDKYEKTSKQMLPELPVGVKGMNRSWENLSSKLAEEARKANKFDEETKPFNKKNLLAALKAIDDGADPIDLKQERPLLCLKPKPLAESMWGSDSTLSTSTVQSKEMATAKTKIDLLQELFGHT